MARNDKWLTGIAPEDPVDRVARRALTTRLAAVNSLLSRAMAKGQKAESVHQLRVWTRRASAALRLFKPALPKAPAKRMKKALRKIRRLAGAVRDCDVYLDRLKDAGTRPPRRVLKSLRRERRAARQKLKDRRRRWQHADRFEKRADKLVTAIAWPKRHSSRDAPPFAPWYLHQIAPLAAQFRKLGAEDLGDDAKLHEFRISAKRLRYALELAGPAIPPRRQRRLYEELSALQDRLGEVCDHLVAVERLRGWLADSDAAREGRALSELLRDEEMALAACRRRFLRWWTAARQRAVRKRWDAAMGEGNPSD